MKIFKINKIILAYLIVSLLLFSAFGTSENYNADIANAKNNEVKNESLNNPIIDKIKNNCKAFFLIEPNSKTVILSNNKEKRLQIASMVKIMTLTVIFDEINKGNLKYDDLITISEKASKIEGSQILLDYNSRHKAIDLIKSIIVASANDSVIALCEKIAGTEENFVKLMNKKATELGLKNTKYVNATGLPVNNQYSSAEDVATIFIELIKNDKYVQLCKIWLEDYVHPSGRKTTMTNTNKLIKYYKGCDAGKTGYTTVAKHCLTATAIRNNLRFIAVVIGANSSKERFFDVSELFNYGFNNYTNKVIFNKNQKVSSITIKGSKNKIYNIYAKDNVSIFSKNNLKVDYSLKIEPINVKAPIAKGSKVANLKIITKTAEYNYDLVVLEEIKRANYVDSLKRIFSVW